MVCTFSFEQELISELAKTEEHLERVTGQCPAGFRGPGFSFSDLLLRILMRRVISTMHPRFRPIWACCACTILCQRG